MERMGKQADHKSRGRRIRAIPGVWEYQTIKESGSEELKYIIDIITAGYAPGRAKERTKNENPGH